jgi:hypothetical protein
LAHSEIIINESSLLGVDMVAADRTHVTHLFYSVTPTLNFAQVVTDLQSTLPDDPTSHLVLTWDCDDIAILDLGDLRLIVGFLDTLPGPHTACFTIAMGRAPGAADPQIAQQDSAQIYSALIAHMERRQPCDHRAEHHLDAELTPDLMDQLGDALLDPSSATRHAVATIGGVATLDVARPADLPMAPVAAPLPVTAAPNDPSDIDRLMYRLTTELTARTPSLISRAIASATPKGRVKSDADASDTSAHGRALPSVSDGQNPFLALAASRLFRRKGAAAQVSTDRDVEKLVAPNLHLARANELKAVRDALYAADQAGQSSSRFGGAGNRLTAQTTYALTVLASFPGGLASTFAELRRSKSYPDDKRLKN